ncbi:MAG: 16S rRNA (cytosine(1402)-N(4))-methyltransferase RsmH [Candidatus Melainabacteria bacterium]|nr:16S rRNA (cytosine(1402)-N(4))-methyltransferase RsmH [Candidatus Melainabacteria bacterium]
MHVPVLLNEVINFLNIKKGRVYVDCTVGTGGHSLEILKRLNDSGKLIGIEQDENILNIAKERLKHFDNCYLFHSNFLELKNILNSLNTDKIDGGVLLDLGTSSLQFDDPKRGFSIKYNSILDMRMNQNQSLTAYQVINTYRENKLADIIYNYGEERYARKIARSIIKCREKYGSIKTTNELTKLILQCFSTKERFKTHPATKTFQAIRIEVNKELINLEKFLCFIPELLLPGSRLTVISFHSLEDRIVKKFIKNNNELIPLTKKPITPSDSEIEKNPRSRSAKLRAAEKQPNAPISISKKSNAWFSCIKHTL